jgi:hypothetical protein
VNALGGKCIKKPKTMDSIEMGWMISRISVFLNQSIDTMSTGSCEWTLPDGSGIRLDMVEKEIRFIDFEGDDKTYYAIVGLAHSHGLTTGDYDSEKEDS